MFTHGQRITLAKPKPTHVALTGLARDLAARASTGKPIRIGLVGAGELGTESVGRVAHRRGIEIGTIGEMNPQAAGRSVTIACGYPDRAQASNPTDDLNAIIEAVRIATTNKVKTLLESGLIDLVIDATGVRSIGAEPGLAPVWKLPVIRPVGLVGAATMMTLTLSVDCRVIDGALGAALFQSIRLHLESPIALLA